MVLRHVTTQTSFIVESAYGTKPTNVDEWWERVKTNGVKITPNYDIYRTQNATASNRKKGREILSYAVQGPASMEIQTGKFFKYILGKVTTTGVGPYTHTYEEDTTNLDLPSFSMQRVENSSHAYDITGLKVASWNVKVSRGDKLMLDAGLVGQDVVSGTQESVTENTSEAYTFSHLDISIDGVAEARLEDFEWSGTNEGIEPTFASDNSAIPRSGKCSSEPYLSGVGDKVVINRDKLNNDLKAKLLAGTQIAIAAVFTRGASDTLTINHSNCNILEQEGETETEGLIKEPLVLEPENSTVVVVNSVATG